MKISKISVSFIIIGVFLFKSCAQKDILSKKSLKNLTYQNESVNFGKAPLKDGEFIESAAPGSVSKTRVVLRQKPVYGTIKGERAAAVILVTDSPGSGVFYDLAVVTENMNNSDVIPVVNLGDRIKVNSIVFSGDSIIVDMNTQAKGESMAKHSNRELRKFIVIQGNELREMKKEKKSDNSLTDVDWKLERVAYANDTEKVIKQPEKYRLYLSEDKKVSIRADCNRGFGSFNIEGSALTISILGTTRAMCELQSFSKKYISELQDVVSYILKDDKLYLSLKYDGGIMEFRK